MCRCRHPSENENLSLVTHFKYQTKHHIDNLPTCKKKMATSAISKPAWGKVKGSGQSTTGTAAAPALGKRAPIPLEDLDLTKIEIGIVEDGSKGDKFVKMNYDGGRFEISLAKLPNYTRSPFKCGPPPNADGLNASWGIRVELTIPQYEKWVALELQIVKMLMPFREQLYPKSGKGKGISEELFSDKYNPRAQPPNIEKGYPASMSLFVQHDETKPMPLIQKMHLRDGKVTRPIKGSIHDLTAKIALAPVANLIRGVYAGNQGVGLKMSLASCDILTNMTISNAPAVDYSGVEFLDEDTPEDTHHPVPTKESSPKEDDAEGGEKQFDSDQFYDAVNGGPEGM